MDDLFGALGIATRFAWFGAIASLILWTFAIRKIWKVEGSRHHLIARTLSALTLIGMDVLIVIFFWPQDYVARVIVLDGEQARALVAFVVGNQLTAAIWQITAPPQGRVQRLPDGRRAR